MRLALACLLVAAACSGGGSTGGLAGVSGGDASADHAADSAGDTDTSTAGTGAGGSAGTGVGGIGVQPDPPCGDSVPSCPLTEGTVPPCSGGAVVPCGWVHRCASSSYVTTMLRFEAYLTCYYDEAKNLVARDGAWQYMGIQRCLDGIRPEVTMCDLADAGTD